MVPLNCILTLMVFFIIMCSLLMNGWVKGGNGRLVRDGVGNEKNSLEQGITDIRKKECIIIRSEYQTTTEGQLVWIITLLPRLLEEGASFSLSTDNPIVTNSRLSHQYQLVTSWGLTEADIVRSVSQHLITRYLNSVTKA